MSVDVSDGCMELEGNERTEILSLWIPLSCKDMAMTSVEHLLQSL